jgi:hypothetical protein
MKSCSGRTLSRWILTITALAFFVGAGNGPAHATLSFQTFASYSTGIKPRKLASVDFNGDARADLAVVNEGSNNASVLMGNGNGTFQPPLSTAVGVTPYDIVTADFNGDGRPDLATACIGGHSLSVLLGNGSGTFVSMPDFVLGQPIPSGVIAGDYTGDGVIDLIALVTGVPETFHLYAGGGNGTFSYRQSSSLGFQASSGIAADFNNDGKLDLALTNNAGNSVTVVRGDGAGNFAQVGSYATGAGPVAVIAGDFNGDGKLDLATVNGGDNTVSVLLGNGDGTFGAHVDYPVGNLPRAITLGDYNGDGKTDLVIANYNDNTVSVLLGKGDGTFQPRKDFPVGNTPQAVISGDFNGDGKTDLAVANYTSDRVTIILNTSVPALTLSPVSHDFGSVPYNDLSSTQTFTISNTGDALLTITAMAKSGANAAEFSISPGPTNPCPALPATLPPGGSCAVSVTFAPTSAGTKSASFDVTSNAPGSPTSASLSGTGIAPTYYPLNLTINGTGTGSVTLSSLSGSSTTCTSSCSASFTSGTTVTMTGTPDSNSVVTWPDCTPQVSCYTLMGGPSVSMSGPESLTATFTYVYPAKIPGTGNFSSLQSSYNASVGGGSIQARTYTFTENVVCAQNIAVSLSGGYDISYGYVSGVTTLVGSLTVTNGTVDVSGLAITP